MVFDVRIESMRPRRGVRCEVGLVSVLVDFRGGELMTRPVAHRSGHLVIHDEISAARNIRIKDPR